MNNPSYNLDYENIDVVRDNINKGYDRWPSSSGIWEDCDDLCSNVGREKLLEYPERWSNMEVGDEFIQETCRKFDYISVEDTDRENGDQTHNNGPNWSGNGKQKQQASASRTKNRNTANNGP